MAMLTPEDLQAIGQIVEQKIDAKVPAMIKAGITGLETRIGGLEARFDDLEIRMDVKFDAVQERLVSIEQTMLTRSDLDHALLNFETRLTDRYDHRYVRRA